MASKARRAAKPRSAKRRAAKRATRRAARKARRASKLKAPKAAKATKPRAPKAKASKRAVRRTKVKKPKRVTRAMQTGSYRKVWNGTSKFTKGGLMKADLMLNKRGKVVSKKAFKNGQRLQKKSGWMTAIMQARKELGITGFCTVNRGAQGIALYKRAKELN